MAAPGLTLFGGSPPPIDVVPKDGPHPSFINVHGTMFRVADYDTPLWTRPNDSAGRWHPAGQGLTTQYWSYSPETAWAESLRRQGIREPDDVVTMRSRIWAAQVEFTAIVDLTDPDWLTWLGLRLFKGIGIGHF